MTDDGPASMEEFLSSLPPKVRAALEEGGDGVAQALDAALSELPEAEAIEVVRKLQEAGAFGGGPDMAKVVQAFTPLFHAIVAVAKGHPDTSLREKIEADLASMEEHGWQLTDPVQRIWAGQRDAEKLTEDIDPNSVVLVQRILELLDQPTPEELLATMPDAVREAFQQKGEAAGEALQAALQAMPEQEAIAIVQKLRLAGLIGG